MNDSNTLRKIEPYFDLIFKIGLLAVILSSFFLFTNLTTEIYETPKFLVLTIFTGLLLVLLALKFTIAGKVVILRTPLDISLLLLLSVGIVSTVLSPSPYVSLLGNNLRVNSSLVALIVYVLLYFVLINNLKSIRSIKWILALIVSVAQILAAVTLLAYAGIKILPAPWTTALNFTPTGSSFSTTAVLALLIPLTVGQILSDTKVVVKLINAIFLTVMGITIALTGTWATWVGAILGFGLTVVAISPVRSIGQIKPISLVGITVPLILVVLTTVISFMPPLGSAKNPIYTAAQNFPREIQLGFVPSWKISVSAFRDSPFWGTGPATYLFAFTNYKPIEFNSTKFWNLRFDSSFNEYLQVLATLGGVGLVAFLSLTALFAASAYRVLVSKHASLEPKPNTLPKALAVSGLVFFVILALHSSSVPVWVIGILILAAFMATGHSEGLQRSWGGFSDLKSTLSRIVNFSTVPSSTETIRVDTLPGILLTISLALVFIAAFFGGKIVLADYHHRLALNAVSQNQGIVAYNELVAAEKFNPVNDLYRTDLAQVNFALANAIASAKGPTEASPTGSLTDQDKQNIQVLLQQSINEGRTAVTLSPKSAVNWEILGLLYRQISGVAQNSLVFSLDSYGRAIFQDPLNPQLRLNVGGVYYAVQSYDMAIRFFTDAINLKPDFANGYYNLSVALRDKGDLNGAQTLAEKVLTLVDQSSPDYKTAQDYLADLKSKTETPIQPPAASTTGALQEEKLPKVIDLPKPEKIATPEAIKKPKPTPSPNPTALPTP